ncbi:MAG TPA: asparaginase [Actinospica sp.]|nr:asparaginase [Actinospica sp.]
MAHEVVLYTLGGTISIAGTMGRPDGVGQVARFGGADLAGAVPGLAETGVALKVEDIEKVPSADLTFAQVLDVVALASARVAAGAAGVVVTQGTDTLEESAYLADLVWPHDEPLIFTGAMRNPTLAGPDGPANLLAAVTAAAHPDARGLGVLVAFNDELHAARWVRKAHATSTATFVSRDAGPIGRMEEERVRILAVPPRRAPLAVPGAEQLEQVRVALHTAVLDERGDELDGIGERFQGLVVAGLGAGHVTARLVPALAGLVELMPVVFTSRAGAGPVLRHTYSAPGSEVDLQNRGLINGGLLHPYKARILLRLLLADGADQDGIRAVFAEHG